MRRPPGALWQFALLLCLLAVVSTVAIRSENKTGLRMPEAPATQRPERPRGSERGPADEVQRSEEAADENAAPSELPPPVLHQKGANETEQRDEVEDDPDYYVRQDLEAQQRMAASTEELVSLTRQQVIATFVSIFGLIATIIFSALATRAASKAAGFAEQTLTGLERPHLFVNDVRMVPPLTRGASESERKRTFYQVHYLVKNYGRSPAIVKEFCGQVYIGRELPDRPPYREQDIHTEEFERVIGSGEAASYRALVRKTIDDQLMHGLAMGTHFNAPDPLTLFFFGYFKYESLFGQSEIVGFCWEYRLAICQFIRADNKNYSYRYRDRD